MDQRETGSIVSHYRLERRLGSGGMGEVFLARDLTLDRKVAIKFLTASEEPHARRRLLQEARSAAALDHPSICSVFEVGTDPGAGDFIVMQYVEGDTLAARLAQGRLSPEITLGILADILRGLSVAHAAGVIHRDLKPQNIILPPSGGPKLLDFGIAKRLVPDSESASATTASLLTRPGATVGTPPYMAPEQVEGGPVDGRSDLFAVGCIAYECLTGRRAFGGVNQAAILGQVLHTQPPLPSSITAGVSPAHDALVMRLLAKSPADRFPSAEEALEATLALDASQSRPSRPAGYSTATTGQGRARRGPVVGVLGFGALAAFALWTFSRPPPLPPAPPDAEGWYVRGVEHLREGGYESARAALNEATRLHPSYVQAYSRLAEALSELDNDRGAQQALLQVSSLVPNQASLTPEDSLRVEAVRASVLHQHEQAVANYRSLAALSPTDAGRWLDVGRAEEALGRRTAARESYERAVALDPQYASAHLRLGAVQAQGGETMKGLASLSEAERLYRAASNREGEGEAMLRSAIVYNAVGERTKARESAERVVQIANDTGYQSLRLRADFQLARISLSLGQFTEAESRASKAAAEAIGAGLQQVAADGLTDLGFLLMGARRYEDADAQFRRAIELASEQKAVRTEMRARLQQASLRLQEDKPEEALTMAAAPLAFYAGGRYPRLEATAKNIVSRANEALEQYEDASRLAAEALSYAESIGDAGMVATSLDNLAGSLSKLGQLPKALAYRSRIAEIRRGQSAHLFLAFELVNRADLLIQLGRGSEAEGLLAEVDARIAEGHQAYRNHARRVALLRAVRASTEGRYADVEQLATGALAADPASTDDTSLTAASISEYAQARLGRSRRPPQEMTAWISAASSPVTRRELGYWVARTLLARGLEDQAAAVARAALLSARASGNLELAWRLGAVEASAVEPGGAGAVDRASIAEQAREDLKALTGGWVDSDVTYLSRADIRELRNAVEGMTRREVSSGGNET